MADEKQPAVSLDKELGHELAANGDPIVVDKVGTEAGITSLPSSLVSETIANQAYQLQDCHDMYRMGKVQQMQRIFRLFPMFSFSMILMASWEIGLGASTISLFNGGRAGTIYMYIVCWIGFLSVYSSMAEMGSMAPTSGGQYHWVSEFAPAKFQKVLSYAVGWLSVLGWQIAVSSTAFQAGTQIQGLLVLNYDWYVYERWHGTLLVIAVVCFAVFFNTFLVRWLPTMEVLLLVFHLCGFFCVLVPLLTLSHKTTSTAVWTEFFDSGWGSSGTSTLVGILANVIPLLGADAAAHMSEELQDASYSLPRTMMYSTLANGALGLIMIISYCYCIGDIIAVATTPTYFAYIQVFYNATDSHSGASAMASVVIIVIIFCTTTMLATTSRQLFAFSRDRGLPFSHWLAHVNGHFQLPVNAIIFSFMFTALISLINIGSTVAFNIINSVGVSALCISYTVCISCLLWRKVTHQPLLPSKYPVGRGSFGITTNIFALCFIAIVFVFSLFPPFPAGHGLNVVTMNWAVLIFGVVVIWSFIYYMIEGRKAYDGPVSYVRKLE